MGDVWATPFEALVSVLDEEHAHGVVEHRQKLRKPLTVLAAKLLAKKFAAVDNPNLAAEMMLENGWQGFEPEWYISRKTSLNKPVQKLSLASAFSQMADVREGMHVNYASGREAIQSPLFDFPVANRKPS